MKTNQASRPPVRKAPTTRVERSDRIRRRLFSAAAEIVGEVGYAGASISLITQRAGVAQGTFYNHFASRQDLLDRLLPSLGEQMLEHIRARALLGEHTFAALEANSFAAFFSFFHENPHFLRILNEAESYAPAGYRQHFEVTSRRYVKFLRRSHRHGEFPAFDDNELETIAFILMSARSYLAVRHFSEQRSGRRKSKIPAAVVNTYLKFVLHGLTGNPRQTAATPRRGGLR